MSFITEATSQHENSLCPKFQLYWSILRSRDRWGAEVPSLGWSLGSSAENCLSSVNPSFSPCQRARVRPTSRGCGEAYQRWQGQAYSPVLGIWRGLGNFLLIWRGRCFDFQSQRKSPGCEAFREAVHQVIKQRQGAKGPGSSFSTSHFFWFSWVNRWHSGVWATG